ncbi:aldo/keto reductase family protein [Aspergillus undulatus]|uniref:aldo/keto reductase family protein n=1 Tax=Aspergillus undulatus TaxID=1810928 RepID=UPI003CCDF7E7
MFNPTYKPRVILGLMTIGPPDNPGARITSLSEFQHMLDIFQASGYTELDTARVYLSGHQESFTARAGYKERDLSIATKVYPLKAGDYKPAALREKFNESLRALQTDSVDIFYLHAPDRSVPFAETLQEVDRLYREGKFKQLGLSNYAAFEVAEIVTLCGERGWVRPTVYQAMYNALIRTIEPEIIPACRRYGLDIVIYNPIAAGVLAGKYKSYEIPQEGRFSTQHPTGQDYRNRYFKDETFAAVQVIKAAATKHGLTMAECAFRWLRHHSALRFAVGSVSGDNGNDGVVIGISSLEQLENNIRDLERGPLPPDVVGAFEQAWELTRATAVKYWHGELEYAYDTQSVLFGDRR